MNIEYWEIWNEPDLETRFPTRRTWTGTREEFFELYCRAALRLKKEFPHLKIGGPALSRPILPYAEAFFAHLAASKERIPLDFFSWHGYVDKKEGLAGVRLRADTARALLEKYGYPEAESIYDEWNYVWDWNQMSKSYEIMGNMQGTAFCAGFFCVMQECKVDKAMYYDAQLLEQEWFCGLFRKAKLRSFDAVRSEVEVRKTYYAFEAFGKLYELGQEVSSAVKGEDLYGCAAVDADRTKCAVLLSHFCLGDSKTKEVSLDFQGLRGKTTVYLLDEDHDLEAVEVGEEPPKQLIIPPDTVYLLVVDMDGQEAGKEDA